MSSLNISSIGQIALVVRDLNKSVMFYRDVLGLSFLFQAPPALAFFMCGKVRVMLTTPEGNEVPGGSTTLYFNVADIHTATNIVRENGVAIESEPHLVAKMADHDLWMSFFRDPDGHLLGLMSEVRS
jgi:methylmalonyl-CoA/ethylmalonyl-CoA epimerase